MAKTIVVRKIANWRHLKATGEKIGQDLTGSPKREISGHIMIFFLFLLQKD